MFSSQEIRESMLLYAVTDSAWLEGRTLSECVQQALEGGATFMQLREKDVDTARMIELSNTLLPLCRNAGVPFVINDDVEAALVVGADGVHVGQDDMACAKARQLLGPDAIVGVSAQTVAQALEAQAAGASYLGVGAVIPTPTKPDAVDVTREELMAIVDAVDIPVVAIGGLNASTVDAMAGTGIDGVAVVSAIFAAQDIVASTRSLKDQVSRMLEKE